VLCVLVVNQWLGRTWVESMLFAVAQAVGLSPELLPAIVSVTLSAGARRLATRAVLELDPPHQARVVRALQHRGRDVGCRGDAINGAPTLRAADVDISVDGAVAAARDSADVVLLQPDLAVLCQGVEEGRRSFANTLKYIGITTSANFGNRVSRALAAPLLPFLPLAAKPGPAGRAAGCGPPPRWWPRRPWRCRSSHRWQAFSGG
jgi:Mg2+-importing ATPase